MSNRIDSLPQYASEIVDPKTWTIVRVDGRAFTRGASAYNRPFDARFHDAFRHATEQALAEMPAAFAHTASDEISFFFAPGSAWFNGRLGKWLTVSAGVASALLARELTLFAGPPSVDARAFRAAGAQEVARYLHERTRNSHENCRNGYVHFGLIAAGMSANAADKANRAMTSAQRWARLPADTPSWQRFGALIGYVEAPHVGVDPRSGARIPTTRNVLRWSEIASPDQAAGLGLQRVSAFEAGAR